MAERFILPRHNHAWPRSKPVKKILADRINKLPKWARNYIMHLETRVDPQHEIEELNYLRDERKALIETIAELKREIAGSAERRPKA